MQIKYIKSKLLKEILELMLGCFLISLFCFGFLYIMSIAVYEKYLYNLSTKNVILENVNFPVWIESICFFSSVVIFLSIFLFFLAQKFSYIVYIINGVKNLKQNNMNFLIEVEGNNELTELAESINYLALSQRELFKQEQFLKQERENMIRSLSHDIRTPLTSILSYSDYLSTKQNLSEDDVTNYINLVKSKSQQIKILTDKLLGKKNNETKIIENGKLFMEQLAYQWEEILEDKFECVIDLSKCNDFKCIFKIEDLTRIFDNIASNIEKYADNTKQVNLDISHKNQKLFITQQNYIKNVKTKIESHKIGLQNIEDIVKSYDGCFEVFKDDNIFKITICLNTIN